MQKDKDLLSASSSESFDEAKHPRDSDGKFTNGGADNHLDNGLIEFVKKVGTLPDNAQYKVGNVSERERNDIERLTGQALNAKEHVINASEIRHTLKRHGTNGLADNTMANVEDFGLIGYVVKNYDYIELIADKSKYRNGQGANAPIILYHKRLDEKTQIVAEAITDGVKGKLRILSAYKTKKEPSV